MTAPSRQRKTLSWIAVTLASAAVLVSIALSYPRSIVQPLLGGEWQCSRMVFMTSCSRIAHGKAAIHGQRTDQIAVRRA
jgi:hypothetical protein